MTLVRLKQHQDHTALQRLRRDKALTPEDLHALKQMLVNSGAGDPEVIGKPNNSRTASACSSGPWSVSTTRPLWRPLPATSTAPGSTPTSCTSST
jgi:hypothetical protein